MKRDLKGSKGMPNVQDVQRSMDPRAVNEVQSVVEHYSGKSDAELLRDLQGFRQAGVISDAALGDVAEKLAPMLNEQQRQRLNAVLSQLQR